MNFMEKANSLSPQLSLRPTGAFNVKEKLNNQNVKYATLPREIVCTGKRKTLYLYLFSIVREEGEKIDSCWKKEKKDTHQTISDHSFHFISENLTPWIKLLPCDNKRGLSTLLNSKNIHNTNYHSLGINFRHICMDKACTRVGLELKQTVSLVHDLIIVGKETSNLSELALRCSLFGVAYQSQRNCASKVPNCLNF